MADVLEVILALRNVQGFVAGAEKAAGAVEGVGTASKSAGSGMTAGWKGMVKWAAGAAAVYGGAKFLKSAVDSTDQLAKSTVQLTKITGMDTATSSEWVGLANQRGVATRQLQMGMVKLSSTIEKARAGTQLENKTVADLRAQIDQVAAAGGKDAPKAIAKLSSAIAAAQKGGDTARKVMAQLGIPLEAIRKGTTDQTLMRVANAFKTMKDPAERAALAQQVFGRAGVQLLPVLTGGAAAVRKLLDEQKKAGNYLSSQGLAQVQSNIHQQRLLEDQIKGVKVQLTLALMPAMIAAGKGLVALMNFIRPVTSNAKLMKVLIYGLAAAFIAWRVALIAATVATKLQKAATEEWTVAQYALNIALDANVIGIVVVAIVALVAVFYEAYKHSKLFRDIVNDTWHVLLSGAQLVYGWFRRYWPYLLGILAGPFGLAAVVIYKHFDTIKKWVLDLVGAIKAAFNDLVRFVGQLPSKLEKPLKKIPGFGAASKAAGWASSGLGHLGLADGGLVSKAGGFLVGERGPELVALPAGAAVSPIPAAAGGAFAAGGQAPIEIVVPLYLDSRELARAIAKVTADRIARR